MKGVVFTEFLDFVDCLHGADMVDDLIEDAALPNGGAYTAVGTYPYQEMQRLFTALSRRSNVSVVELLRSFGHHLCARFYMRYPEFFAASTGLFDFLESVDGYIHVEVHKLYPDAELPRFETRSRESNRLEIDYLSCRALDSLAEGMILGAAAHYGEVVAISRTRVPGAEEPVIRFSIQHAA